MSYQIRESFSSCSQGPLNALNVCQTPDGLLCAFLLKVAPLYRKGLTGGVHLRWLPFQQVVTSLQRTSKALLE